MSETNNKKIIITQAFGHFITDLYSGFLNPIMPFIAVKIGITMTLATIMIAISNLTSSLSQPFFGYIADKWQKRFFVFWGMLFASIFLSFVGIASNVYILFVFLILGSMGVSFFHPQATSIVATYSLEEKDSRNMSFFIASGTFGFALGPAVSSGITQFFGAEKLPYICVIGVIAAFILLKNTPNLHTISEKKPNISIVSAIKKIFSNKPVSVLVNASIVKSFVVSSLSIILPFYWQREGINVGQIGTSIFAFMLAGALGVVASPFFERKIGVRKVFYLSLLPVFPLGLVFYLCGGKGITGIASFILIGFISFLAVPVNMSLAQRLMPDFKSMISGFIGGFSWGVIGLILPLISLFAEKIGILNIIPIITIIPLMFAYYIKYLPETE